MNYTIKLPNSSQSLFLKRVKTQLYSPDNRRFFQQAAVKMTMFKVSSVEKVGKQADVARPLVSLLVMRYLLCLTGCIEDSLFETLTNHSENTHAGI